VPVCAHARVRRPPRRVDRAAGAGDRDRGAAARVGVTVACSEHEGAGITVQGPSAGGTHAAAGGAAGRGGGGRPSDGAARAIQPVLRGAVGGPPAGRRRSTWPGAVAENRRPKLGAGVPDAPGERPVPQRRLGRGAEGGGGGGPRGGGP